MLPPMVEFDDRKNCVQGMVPSGLCTPPPLRERLLSERQRLQERIEVISNYLRLHDKNPDAAELIEARKQQDALW